MCRGRSWRVQKGVRLESGGATGSVRHGREEEEEEKKKRKRKEKRKKKNREWGEKSQAMVRSRLTSDRL
ncbi:hypothetical protein CDL15_Pgr017073 [Punica granatum]|uniref:Uncharacterized protein n=1 Tax=Punica granatum TaxID=22663 RepID=A0A218WYF3_PUNGR|nr:hypothetical protein CDL15_Pgr017073 [Punica granatum]